MNTEVNDTEVLIAFDTTRLDARKCQAQLRITLARPLLATATEEARSGISNKKDPERKQRHRRLISGH